MITCQQLLTYCNELLQVGLFRDYCPNGLQVEGNTDINRIVTGVSASQALIERAVELKADALLVHHGFFWKGESQPITGMKKRRIKRLLEHNINLLAYHLPLDAHPTLGNNSVLAGKLGISDVVFAGENNILLLGQVEEQSGRQFAQKIESVLSRKPQHIEVSKTIGRVALCTGAAQNLIETACMLGADAYISGEISEPTYHFAQENNLHYYAAGHHATERYGVAALGEHLADSFAIEHRFIDIYNPV